MFSDEIFLYGKRDKNNPVPLLINKVQIESLIQQNEIEISIDGKLYFNNVNFKYTKNSAEAIWGNCILVNFNGNDKDTLNLRICKNLSLDKLLAAEEFMRDLFINKHLEINNQSVEISNFDCNFNLNDYEKQIMLHKKIMNLLIRINVESSTVIPDNLKENDSNKLISLVSYIIDGKLIHSINAKTSKRQLTLLNKKILLMEIQEDSNTLKVILFNELSNNLIVLVQSGTKEELCRLSPYLILSKDDIIQNVNISVEDMFTSIVGNKCNDCYAERVITSILILIHAYDDTKNHEYLTDADKLLDWLILYDDTSSIYKINKYQILYRQNKLSPSDYLKIDKLISEYKEENHMLFKCCGYILLENYDKFKKCYIKLAEEEKQTFKSFPIYNLYVEKQGEIKSS